VGVRRTLERGGVPRGPARSGRAGRHTHVPAAWQQTPGGARRVDVDPGTPLDVATGKWLLNPGAVGAPVPSRLGWWGGLDIQAADGAFWLLLDLEARTATWLRAPYDPAPARKRARELRLLR
jgi:hypothetical protein